jgi:hypothetical protein
MLEVSKLSGRDRLNLVENGPEDAFSAGGRGERAIVGPVVVDVELAAKEAG